MTAIVNNNPSVTVKLLLTFNPGNANHDAYMEEKVRKLRLDLIDNFPSLTDTQVRKINKISSEVCSCSIHIVNYPIPKITRYIQKLTTDIQDMTMLRILEFTITGENT